MWLFGGGASQPSDHHGRRKKYSLENLMYLYQQLNRYKDKDLSHDSSSHLAPTIEIIRSIAELMIWGDQHEEEYFFDFFCEKNILSYFIKILSMKVAKPVKVQLLQTLSILVQNINRETSIYYLLSNNHVNSLISTPFEWEDEEILAYYITFLKSLSLKLNKETVKFFYNERAHHFPLYTEAIKFFNHKDSMVRTSVRTLTLNVFGVSDPSMRHFILSQESRFFTHVATYLVDMWLKMELTINTKSAIEGLGSLPEQFEEHEDLLLYVSDILSMQIDGINKLLTSRLFRHALYPVLIRSILRGKEPVASSHKGGGPSPTPAAMDGPVDDREEASADDGRTDHTSADEGESSASLLSPTLAIYLVNRILMVLYSHPCIAIPLTSAVMNTKMGHHTYGKIAEAPTNSSNTNNEHDTDESDQDLLEEDVPNGGLSNPVRRRLIEMLGSSPSSDSFVFVCVALLDTAMKHTKTFTRPFLESCRILPPRFDSRQLLRNLGVSKTPTHEDTQAARQPQQPQQDNRQHHHNETDSASDAGRPDGLRDGGGVGYGVRSKSIPAFEADERRKRPALRLHSLFRPSRGGAERSSDDHVCRSEGSPPSSTPSGDGSPKSDPPSSLSFSLTHPHPHPRTSTTNKHHHSSSSNSRSKRAAIEPHTQQEQHTDGGVSSSSRPEDQEADDGSLEVFSLMCCLLEGSTQHMRMLTVRVVLRLLYNMYFEHHIWKHPKWGKVAKEKLMHLLSAHVPSALSLLTMPMGDHVLDIFEEEWHIHLAPPIDIASVGADPHVLLPLATSYYPPSIPHVWRFPIKDEDHMRKAMQTYLLLRKLKGDLTSKHRNDRIIDVPGHHPPPVANGVPITVPLPTNERERKAIDDPTQRWKLPCPSPFPLYDTQQEREMAHTREGTNYDLNERDRIKCTIISPQEANGPQAITRYIVQHSYLLLLCRPHPTTPGLSIVTTCAPVRSVECMVDRSEPRHLRLFIRSTSQPGDAMRCSNRQYDATSLDVSAVSASSAYDWRAKIPSVWEMLLTFEDAKRCLTARRWLDGGRQQVRKKLMEHLHRYITET